MAVLEAGLAFALSMLVFSTLVSVIVEALHRILRLRQRGFHEMIEVFYDDVIVKQWASRKGIKLSNDAVPEVPEIKRQDFTNAFTGNRAVRKKGFFGVSPGRTVDSLSTVEFIERLAETPIGRKVIDEGKEKAEKTIDEFALKFERFGDNARAYFRGRAHFISILVAVCLAFFGNIHSAKLFNGFLHDPELTEKWVTQADSIMDAYKKIEDQSGQINKEETSFQKTASETKRALSEASKKMSQLATEGLPVGEKYYPICATGSPDTDCKKYLGEDLQVVKTGVTRTLTILADDIGKAINWALLVFLSGMLIGLGGPFWFDTVVSLMKSRQMLSGMGLFKNKKKVEDKDPAQPVEAPDTALPSSVSANQPKTPVEAFMRAAEAVHEA